MLHQYLESNIRKLLALGELGEGVGVLGDLLGVEGLCVGCGEVEID